MTQNINNYSEFEILSLLFQYIARRINLMHVLLILSFLTFGIGDAVTAGIMMEARGIAGESNMIAAYIYANHGFAGLIAAKIWMTIIILGGALFVYWRSGFKSYWMVNGFLTSIIIGGAMATIANLQAAAGLPFMSPAQNLLIFTGMVLVLIEAGDIVDNHNESSRPERYPWHETAMH